MAVQESDGHWRRIRGWTGGLTGTALRWTRLLFQILLYDILLRATPIESLEAKHYAPLIKTATGYIVGAGPITQQDRWELEVTRANLTKTSCNSVYCGSLTSRRAFTHRS